MKRRAISLITVLALCLSLCPVRAMAATWDAVIELENDPTLTSTYAVTNSRLFILNGHSYTINGQTAMSVKSAGKLYLENGADETGTVESTNGAGVEVQGGGFLCVNDPGVTVIGTTYGLDIASGAAAELSGGTFKGTEGAIQAGDGNYAGLLVRGYAYFDENGRPVPLAEVAGKTTVTVKACTGHSYDYTPNEGVPTHDGICQYCGDTVASEKCTFQFDTDGSAACADCGRTITIAIDPGDLVYDGASKPAGDPVTVKLDGTTTLTEDTDYTVEYTPGKDAGDSITVTVTGITYNGTFAKTFSITQAQPSITWDTAAFNPGKDYDGTPIDETDLPGVTITAKTASDEAELRQRLYFSYKKDGDTDFTAGLPTDAGTYEIKANLPATQNYLAASSDPLTLTINKIDPMIEDPVAAQPVYNGAARELVTRGKVWDGAVILFAASQEGPYSETVPTGINAGKDYQVWYKVEESKNFTEVPAKEIQNVEIRRKPITPEVTLEYTSYVYTGGEIQPKVTVKDTDDWTVLQENEYTVAYTDNQNVGTAAVTVTDKEGGNYAITEVKVNFEITPKDQKALTITNQPGAVSYGDKFTLGTSGGSGNGTVTWTIVSGADSATIDPGGQVTVTGLSEVTVQATRSGSDYKDATAQWTFTAGPKHVTATVTAASKIYDGKTDAIVTAVVEQSDLVLPGDTISITGLAGAFNDANAGTGKTVTVDTSGAQTGGDGEEPGGTGNKKYIVTIPKTAAADITKATTAATAPAPETLAYDGAEHELVTAGKAYLANNTSVEVPLEYARSAGGPYSAYIPKATDAGSYEIWYCVQGTDNYFGTTAAKVVVTIAPKSVTAAVELSQTSYIYDGSEKKPAVTVKDGNDTIPASEYTVAYSNNVNVGTAAVTVTAKAGGNYTFTNGPVEKTFTITKGSAVLNSPPKAVENLTYNGNPQDLVSAGSATGGHLEYSLTGSDDYSETIPQGTQARTYTVYYKAAGDENHTDTAPAYVFVTIRPKTVSSPEITLEQTSYTYNNDAKTPNVTSVKDDEGKPVNSDEYTVTYSNNVNAGTATVLVKNVNGGNYLINSTAEFTIGKADPTVNAPTGKGPLQYNGTAQALITRGSSQDGTMVYALGADANYSEAIPTASAVGTHTVYYKVLGDSNHKDSTPATVTASIIQNTVTNPTITLSADTFRYNGSQQIPTVTVRDDNNLLIPENEYKVTVTGTKGNDSIAVDTYTVTITASTNSNYVFQSNNTRTYQIVEADQETISITGTRGQVCYGDTIQLGITGGTGSGTVTWTVTGGNTISDGGLLTINEVGGPYVVTATRTSTSGNYDVISTTWEFSTSKKPVTAVLTGVDKTYDGGKTAAVKAKVNPGDLVGGDSVTISDLTGEFEDADVGTDKRITVTTADPTVSGTNSGNYAVTYPDTATADITPKQITPAVTLGSGPFVYTGAAITPNVNVTYTDGTLTLQPGDYTVAYSDNINAGTATVTVKNVSGGNYLINSTAEFTIGKADPTVNAPTGKMNLTYNGAAQELIYRGSSPDGKMVYALGADANYSEDVPTGTAAGTYTVYYKVLGDSNHKDSTPGQVTAVIAGADQNPLTITNLPGLVYYGDAFTLSTTGGSGTGTVTWTSSDTGVAAITPNGGLVTVIGVGEVTITATKAASANYEETTAAWTFTALKATAQWAAQPKPASGLIYTGSALPLLITGAATVNGIGTVEYSQSENGTYSTDIPKGTNAGAYEVWYRVAESDKWTGIGPVYLGEVTIARKEVRIQTIKLDGNGGTGEIPNLIVQDSEGNTIPASEYTVTVDVDDWTSGSSFTATVTAKPDGNYDFEPANSGLLAVAGTETPVGGGSSGNTGDDNSAATPPTTTQPGTESPSTQTTVRDGTASTVVNSAAGNRLVNEAVANQSENIVIKPEITGDVTKTEVSLPASMVSRIGNETDAALTVSTPIADVTIPNGALDALSGAGGTVSVVTEQVGNTVVLTLTANGRNVGDVPGGLTLTVPAEDAGPGTVAVLVHEDGTREIIRKSVAEDGGVRIPLNGSATVEIVDNSKKFSDVPAESWAADAVAFVSAHEMFNGTGETTFSPELSMSRAMLATVLYNLEGSPDQDLAGVFSDVSDDAWYAASVSWAVENGIASGYGNGQLGPNDSVTREQLAVMLWRYAGSPAADERALDFTDADRASGYAMEALRWAAANGILNGYGDGRLDPGGLATRAQAAQMLKNFMENT